MSLYVFKRNCKNSVFDSDGMSGRNQFCISAAVLFSSIGIAAVMIGITKYVSSRPDVTEFWTDAIPKVPFDRDLAHIEIFVTGDKRQKGANNSYYWLEDELITSKVFTTRFVSTRDMGGNTLVVDCSDEDTVLHRCIKRRSVETILTDYPNTHWFVYYSDPFSLNLTNLNRYLQLISQIYDPKVHLVAKGPNIPGYPNVELLYSHGVLIKSRALIEFEIKKKLTGKDLQQTFDIDAEVAEAIVIEEIIPKEDWYEPFIVNAECGNCNKRITECFGFKYLLNMKDAIAWKRYNAGNEVNENWMNMSENTFFYYDRNHFPHVCTVNGAAGVVGLSLKEFRKHAALVTAKNVPVGKIRSIQNGKCKQCTQTRIR